jgi:putative transposase
MPEYRRSRVEGGTYFFTVVTYNRLPILTTTEARKLLRSAWENVRERFPFTSDALCLLPDHIHCIWILPEGDANFSVRWKEIKRLFTRSYLSAVGPGETRNASRLSRGEAAIWQRRFWEHTIRDEKDLNHHRDYIHYNPVKHGLVQNVSAWPWSSFHRYVRTGYYERGWGETVGEEVNRLKCGE